VDRNSKTKRVTTVRLIVLAAIAVVALAVVALLPASSTPKTPAASASAARRLTPTSAPQASPAVSTRPAAGTACPCADLATGSDPSVLPGPVLIADHMNNRLLIVDPNGTVAWQFPRPGDLAPGQTFKVPDDAFFTPDGKDIVVTEEDDFVIRLISVAQHRILWTYGTPGVTGSGPNQLWNPDDAMMRPDGTIIAADIKNCRVLVLRPGVAQPVQVYGTTTSDCRHDPPSHWGSPNGAFPMADGNYLITEINGDWVDQMSPAGQIGFSTNPPGVAYPSDTNEVRPGVYLTADYSTPGQIEEFDPQGRLLWRYAPTGADALNMPSLALPLSNGDVIANDDSNHRVIVIDPRTDRIVWQYGHTGQPGTTPGYLNTPDGVDLAPPLSLTMVHASTMGG
jgi:outer membrane protein assembly factor BamB